MEGDGKGWRRVIVRVCSCLLFLFFFSSSGVCWNEEEGGFEMRWDGVVLAAGYGTRLRREIEVDRSGLFAGLVDVAKPLLPLGGRVVIDWWLDAFEALGVVRTVVVTNEVYGEEFEGKLKGREGVEVVRNGSRDVEGRLGAIGDLHLGLKALEASEAGKGQSGVLIVAGDTLLVGTEVADVVSGFERAASLRAEAGVVAYELGDLSEAKRRGMLCAQREDSGLEVVTRLVEKPQTAKETPSRLASMPIYFLRRATARGRVEAYLETATELPKRDAPGQLLAWLVKPEAECTVALVRAKGRIDVGGLAQYKHALDVFQGKQGACRLLKGEVAVGSALPRLGLLGNPSDGYRGKTISVLVEGTGMAEVTALSSDEVTFIPNDDDDLLSFRTTADLQRRVDSCGYNGALRLVQAATKKFLDKLPRERHEGFRMAYHTTIPRMVGLAGSSALIYATLRCLCRLFGVEESEIGMAKEWPKMVLQVEVEQLGIVGGLQDRVVQQFGGLLSMDFKSEEVVMRFLDENKLPDLYIAYPRDDIGGSSSSTVHQSLRKRWEEGEEKAVKGMQELAKIAEQGASLWDQVTVNRAALADLMACNVELRKYLIGEKHIDRATLSMIRLARMLGMAPKFAGSGGCVVCLPRITPFDDARAREKFAAGGFHFLHVKVAPRREPTSTLKRKHSDLGAETET